MSDLQFQKISGTRSATGEADPRLVVAIPSYERPQMLRRLIAQLNSQAAVGDLAIYVFDDGSDCDYGFLPSIDNVAWFRREANGGKSRFWELWRELLGAFCGSDAEAFFVIPDDADLAPDFLDRSLRIFHAIDDPRRGCLNPLLDVERIGRGCWTNYRRRVCRFGGETVYQTQWTDCCLVTDRAGLAALDWSIAPIGPDRWRRDPDNSSGVGEQLTRHWRSVGRNLYQVTASLIYHGRHESRMNPRERVRQPLTTTSRIREGEFLRRFSSERIVAGMATIPSRTAQLQRAVTSLAPQVDEIHVYCNGFRRLPRFLRGEKIVVHASQAAAGDLGDAGKFYAADTAAGFYFGCDDDIVYPPDFVERMIGRLETYDRQVAVSAHGATVSPPLRSYYRDKVTHHCQAKQLRDVAADVLGTGVLAFHTGTIRFSVADCLVPNMADIWFAIAAQRQRVGLVVIAHAADWIEIQDVPTTIYDVHREADHVQTQLLNARRWRRWAPESLRDDARHRTRKAIA